MLSLPVIPSFSISAPLYVSFSKAHFTLFNIFCMKTKLNYISIDTVVTCKFCQNNQGKELVCHPKHWCKNI